MPGRESVGRQVAGYVRELVPYVVPCKAYICSFVFATDLKYRSAPKTPW